MILILTCHSTLNSVMNVMIQTYEMFFSESSLTFKSHHVEVINFINFSSVTSTFQSSNSQAFIELQLVTRFLQLNHHQAEIA